jgi:hypothetical protein
MRKVLCVVKYISISTNEVFAIDNINWTGIHVYVLEDWN